MVIFMYNITNTQSVNWVNYRLDGTINCICIHNLVFEFIDCDWFRPDGLYLSNSF